MTKEMETKIEKLLEDKEYVLSLSQMQTSEDIQASLEGNGIEISSEDINTVKELIQKVLEKDIKDEDLEKVSGGLVNTGFNGTGKR